VDPDRAAEREATANRLDKAARHIVIGVIPLAVIAVVDLASGSLMDDKRLDLVVLAGMATGLWGAFSTRKMARRIRSGEPAERPSTARLVAAIASTFLSLAFPAVVGYLVGGWVAAVVLLSFMIVLTACSIAIGLRRRRRTQALGG
jgi:hypothetical protein